MAAEPVIAAPPSLTVPLRPAGQIAVAIVLTIPTFLLGHLFAFGLAHVGHASGSHPTGTFFYSAGEGLAASVCSGLFLLRLIASTASRVWCWIAAFVLWVGAMPAWGVLLGGETMHFALILILGCVSFLMWSVWLPWWNPRWCWGGVTEG